GEGSSAPTFVAIYLANLSIANRSSVVLAAPHGQGALLRWPFQALLVLNTNISNSSEMTLSALTLNVSGNVVYAAAYILETRVVESSVLSLTDILVVDAFPVPAVNRIVLSGITAAASSHVSFVNVSCAAVSSAYYCIQIDRVVSNHSRLTIASGTALSLLISSSTFVDSFVDLFHYSGLTANVTVRSCSLRVSSLERQRLCCIYVGNLPNLTFSKIPIVVTLDTVTVVVPWTGLPTAAAPWVSVVLLNTTSHQLTVVMVVEQLQLLGSVSFVDATSLSNSIEAALSIVMLRCSWWGRHAFTGALEPVSLALRGQVFRGPRSAVTPTTSVTASYSSSTYPTSALCSSRYGGYAARLAGASWSNTLSQSSYLIATATGSKSSSLSLTAFLVTATYELLITTSEKVAVTSTATRSHNITDTHTLPLSITPTSTSTLQNRSTTLQVSSTVLKDSRSHTMNRFTLTNSISDVPTTTQTSHHLVMPSGTLSARSVRMNTTTTLSVTNLQHAVDIVPITATPALVESAPLVLSVGALIGGGVAGGGDATVLATLTMMTCGGRRTWDSNTGPQRLAVSVFYDLGPAAAVLGNLGITLTVFAAMCLAACCRSLCKGVALSDSFIALRVPSIPWRVFTFLLPGMMFSAVSLVANDVGEDEPPLAFSEGGRIAMCIIVLLVVVCGGVRCTMTVLQRTLRPSVFLSSTEDVFCEPYLPPWFSRLFGHWLLSRCQWEPASVRLQFGSFYVSVASREAMWVQPALQFHAAVFSLIAAIPFPQSACIAQFVLAMAWMLVPVALVGHFKFNLLRRPFHNHLLALSALITIGVLGATAVFVDGSVAITQRDNAATARDVLSIVLSVVSAIKIILGTIGEIAEWYAKRRFFRIKNEHTSDGKMMLLGLELFGGDETPATPTSATTPPAHLQTDQGMSSVRVKKKKRKAGGPSSLDSSGRSLDQQIDDVLNADVFTATRDARLLSADQWERLRGYTLELLVTRAARGVSLNSEL
ncbi:membrane-associated protein, putative, partial [Bodo saltans]